MDFMDTLRELAAKIPKLKESGLLRTEEATKNALIMPFINALGYNVFDPLEVTPELVADVGVKKGEKVDYAILKDGKPIILFECKIFGTDLSQVHASQLYRYFSVTEARFGILTDGVAYRFYTDLDKSNVMDNEPFLTFSLTNLREGNVEELKKFSKSAFDVDVIAVIASDLKYKTLIKTYLNKIATQPSEAFVKLVLKESGAYKEAVFQSVLDQFTPIIRDAIRMFISEQVETRLKNALASEAAVMDSAENEAALPASLIETSEQEREAFMIVRAIVRSVLDVKRVTMRDAQSYCVINIDDNNRRPLCRLHLNSATHKYLGLFDAQRTETKMRITSLDDLYQYADQLRATAALYVAPASAVAGS